MNENSIIELKWWVQNLELYNGQALIQPPPEVSIQTDASTKGWGATCNGISTGGMWFAQEMKNHVIVLELSAIKLDTNIFENLEAQSHSSPPGQHGSFDISVKDGRYPEFKTSPISKRNMGSSSPVWDHSSCRVPSQQTERDSRLGVKKQFGLLGMETSSPVISENLSTEGNPRDRYISFQIILSDQDLLFLEARSIEPSSRCLPTKLVPQESI